MNDRELLELAAKASGLESPVWVDRVDDYDSPHFRECALQIGRSAADTWNPLIDDGDALRLAVKLEMDVLIHEDFVSVRTHEHELDEDARGTCIFAATRRTIVRSAAEIGKAMP